MAYGGEEYHPLLNVGGALWHVVRRYSPAQTAVPGYHWRDWPLDRSRPAMGKMAHATLV